MQDAEALVSHCTWNVGGVASAQVEVGLHELQREAQSTMELISFQELPRGEVGWQFHEIGKWFVYSYREMDEWRASGVGYRSDLWTLMRKRASAKGMWLRLRRKADGAEVWCGSTYLSPGASREQHGNAIHTFLEALPATTLPVLLGGDMNTPVKWSHGEGARVEASGPESKGDYMVGLLASKGVSLTAPVPRQWSTPTSRPRRQEAHGRQIDMVGCKHCEARPAVIHEGSHLFLGTSDHDAVSHVVGFRLKPSGRPKRGSQRPRVVVEVPRVEGELNQQKLERLARTCTKPVAGNAYQDPEDVKVLFRMARHGKRPEDWKAAMKARLGARKRWMENKIEAATKGDWGAFKVATKTGATGWEGHLADALGEGSDPHREIHGHLQAVYGRERDKIPAFPYQVEQLERVPDFTVEELRDALRKGKKRVAVGPDKVSHELLQAIGDLPEGENKILAWFNKLLQGSEPIPKEWSRASMVLLPKVQHPTEVRHVRPICIGSSASKLFARMLLARTSSCLNYESSAQCMGQGRQATDYVFSIARLMQLDQEWRSGLCFMKIDVEKAFDTLDRKALLSRLTQKLGVTRVLRCWWEMFEKTDALLSTVCGESVIDMYTGIRQGSVESPQMFSTVVDWILQDAAVKYGWEPSSSPLQGLQLGEVAFVDDLIAWEGSRTALSTKMSQLAMEMRAWGLRVNARKCQVYISPYNREAGAVKLEGTPITQDDHLLVMGMQFKVGITPREVLAPIFAKVKSRFWAQKTETHG